MGMCSSFCIFQFSLGYALDLICKFINTNTFVRNGEISHPMGWGHLYPPWVHLERDLLTQKGSSWWDSALFSSMEKPTMLIKWFGFVHVTPLPLVWKELSIRAHGFGLMMPSRGQSQLPWGMTVPVLPQGREERALEKNKRWNNLCESRAPFATLSDIL